MAPKPQGLAYRLLQTILPDHNIVASYVCWDSDPVNISADDAMADNGSDKSARDEAEEFLRELLVDGPVTAKQVKSEATNAAISWRTVMRAKSQLGVQSQKDGFQGEWTWTLPKDANNAKECHF